MSPVTGSRVLLVDDHPLVRAGVRRVLETNPDIRIVAEAASGDAALQLLERERPDVLVLDLAMPDTDGLEVLRRVKRRWPELGVVILTMHANPEYLKRAIQYGVDAYVLKESAAQELVAAVDRVRRGQSDQRLEPRSAPGGPPLSLSGQRTVSLLTPRECEVLRDIALGLATKEIAARLRLSVRTVETHRANLTRKLGLHSVALLTRFALREGLVPGSAWR